MVRGIPALAVLALLVAGCSGSPAAQADAESAAFDDLGVSASATTGILLGVVVDEAIRPLPDVTISLTGPAATSLQGTTDAAGRFAFGNLEPGTYFVTAQHFLFEAAQTTIEVQAGDDNPRVNRIQLTRLFSQQPFHETLKAEGFIQCGYSISGVMSSLCLNDYTHFVGPYTCPQCEHILDRRSADFEVGPGWQTMVFEMTWEPTQQATSDQMRLTISHFPRSASHWYCSGIDSSPILLRMDVGVACEDQQSEPELVPPEGLPNMHLFAATAATDQPVSAVWSQSFNVYMNFFYYGSPPAEWSFVAGDEPPF